MPAAHAEVDRLFGHDASWIQPAGHLSSGSGCCDEGCLPCDSPGANPSAGHASCDDLWTRSSLTNGLWGAGKKLAENGIVADLQLTQFYQGVSSGGSEQNFEYGGKLDYQFTFLGEKLGLWKGFTTIMHAETRFGEDVNADAGALALPNANMLFPRPGAHETSISGLLFMQALNERFALAAGKFNLLDLWHMIYPHSGRGIEGFMNTSLLAPIPIIRTTNLSINGAGAMVMEGKQIQGAVLVYDTNNSSTTAGLDNLFDEGAVLLGYWRFFTDIGGLPGSHAFMGNWSSRTYTSVDPASWAIIPGQGLVPGQETGSWTLTYLLDQVLWADRCNKERNLRLFSQWMLADGNPNLYRWSGNVAIQGTGLVPGRDADTMGIGYFYDGLSGDFKRLLTPVVALQDTQGIEMYYNAAITPWFHLTADLQVVDNQNVTDDAAVIPGLRANIRF